MKCPHCGKTHPDDTDFCPRTGQKIERHTCSNPDCNFRSHLPFAASFCPACGNTIGGLNMNTSSKDSAFSVIALQTGYNQYKLIDLNCKLISDTVDSIVQMEIEDDTKYISDLIGLVDSRVIYVSNSGQLQEIGKNSEQIEAVVSIYGEYVLYIANRFASLFKKSTKHNLIPISQFRLKHDEVSLFDVVGEYISFFYWDGFASINIKSGEQLRLKGYKHSMVLAIIDGEPIYLVSNSTSITSEKCEIVNKNGTIMNSFPKGVYWPKGGSNFLIRYYNFKGGIVSTDGNVIIPPYFDSIDFQDSHHLVLKIGREHDWPRRKVLFDLNDKSYTLKDWYSGQEIICRDRRLPSSVDNYDEILDSYKFGNGYSTELLINDNNNVVRRIDNSTVYYMSEEEYPVGWSDTTKRFAITDNEYISIYDQDGKFIKEFYMSNGIANISMTSTGVIHMFDSDLREFFVIDADLNLFSIKNKNIFGGHCEIISSNCIAVDLPLGDLKMWQLYNNKGELILPKNMSVLSWKRLNDTFAVLDIANYRTDDGLSLSEKKGILLNLHDNTYTQIPIPYENAFALK